MSIEQINIIDFLSINADAVVLTISDHLDWDSENKHLLLLQQKINSYLAFIESGEILKKYPDSEGRRPVISIKVMHAPNKEALTFFADVDKAVSGIGIGFKYEYTPLGLSGNGAP
jgi:hypothetical protein